jgi:hypothetical protein
MISDVAKVGLEGLNHLARFNCGDPEGQYRCGASMPAFDLPDLDAQRLKGGWGPHSERCPQRAQTTGGSCSLFVLHRRVGSESDPHRWRSSFQMAALKPPISGPLTLTQQPEIGKAGLTDSCLSGFHYTLGDWRLSEVLFDGDAARCNASRRRRRRQGSNAQFPRHRRIQEGL